MGDRYEAALMNETDGPDDATLEAIGRSIDRLITIDVGQRGVIDELYDAAHTHHGRSPTMEAAERLVEHVSPGDDVLIATGFPADSTLVQETDGPMGAVCLARAIRRGLGAHPTIVLEERGVHTVDAAARAFELSVEDYADAARTIEDGWTCTIDSLPLDWTESDCDPDEYLDDLDPSALIAIERAGANAEGVYHKSSGQNVTDDVIEPEPLFEHADGDALTIGIGDGGNELGMGTIYDRVADVVPKATACGCGCGGGIAAASTTDVIVTATISNWGGYGIAAALSTLCGDVVLHDPETEERALRAHSFAGALDAGSGAANGCVDGVSLEAQRSVVELLHAILAD